MQKLQLSTAAKSGRSHVVFLTAGLAAAVLALASCGEKATKAPAEQPAAAAQASAPAASAPTTAAPTPAAPGDDFAGRVVPDQVPAPAEHADHPGHEDHAQPSAASSTFANLPNNARLDIEVTDHDFGSAVEGEVLVHVFPMKSSGEGPLVISSAKPTCGCTVSMLEIKPEGKDWSVYEFGKEIPAGTEMRLTAELDTKNKKNVASSRINIFCNDPRSTVTLGLKAVLDTYFNITPNSIDFGELSVADAVERTFEVSAKQPGAFLLTLDEKTTPEGIAVTLLPQDPDASGKAERWKVQVKLGPSAREGNLGFPVSLMSDIKIAGAAPGVDGQPPTYGATVLTSGRVRGLISWEPQYLSFGLVKPGQVASRTFNVQTFDPTFVFSSDLKTRFAGYNDAVPEFKWASSFSAVVRPAASGKGIDVEVTLNGLPEGSDGSFQGRLMLETGHPAKPEIGVLFSGVCRAGVGTVPAGAVVPANGGSAGK